MNLASINLAMIVNWFAYWVAFWTIVNIIMPPRETFKDASPGFQRFYNTLLVLISYYGSLNVRQFTVRLYSVVDPNAPSPQPPPKEDVGK